MSGAANLFDPPPPLLSDALWLSLPNGGQASRS